MKTFLTITCLVALSLLINPQPTTVSPEHVTKTAEQTAEQTSSVSRVREFLRGERDYVDEEDLYSPSVPAELREAAIIYAD